MSEALARELTAVAGASERMLLVRALDGREVLAKCWKRPGWKSRRYPPTKR